MKNKKVIFAIILFLLIGLTIFTFANPSSNEKTFDEEQKEIQDDDSNTKDDINTTTVEEDNSESDITANDNNTNEVPNNIMVGNQDQNVTIVRDQITTNAQNNNNNYNNALAAVVKAEGTITQSDVDVARDLVGKLDDGDEKENLENRLDQVQDIIDVSGLIATLEDKTNNSESRKDILAARSYRDDEEKIKERVESLKKSKEKDDLESRLNDLSSILDDNTAPKIEGAPNDEYTNTVPVSLTLDGEDYTITVNDTEYTDELSFSKDDKYTVTVTDKAFNEATVKFTIDTVKPTFKNVSAGSYIDVESLKVEVEDDNLSTITANGKEINNNSELTDEGIYHLVATDKAGNKSDVYVAIDKTAPEFKDVTNGDIFNEEKTVEIIEKVRLSEVVVVNQTTGETVTYSEHQLLNNNKITLKDEGTYLITAKDKVASHPAATITITIDKTDPTIPYAFLNVSGDATNVVTDESGMRKSYFKNGDSFVVGIQFSEELKETPTLTIGGRTVELIKENAKQYKATFSIQKDENELKEGLLEIILSNVVDMAGNSQEDSQILNITNLNNRQAHYDRTMPTIIDDLTKEPIIEGKTYKEVKPVIDGTNSPIKTATLNDSDFTSGTLVDTNGEYKLVVTDLAGNSYEVSFTIDNIAPTLTKLQILNLDNLELQKDVHYINDEPENRIRFTVSFDEEIDLDKIEVKINGKAVTISRKKMGDPGYYNIDIRMKNVLAVTSLDENKPISFEIAGLQDKNGNLVNEKGNEKGIINNDNIKNAKEYDHVIYDSVKPVLKIWRNDLKKQFSPDSVNGIYYHHTSVAAVVTEDNDYTITLNGTEIELNTLNDIKYGLINKTGEIIATDAAGNKSEILKFQIDIDTPGFVINGRTYRNTTLYFNKDVTISYKESSPQGDVIFKKNDIEDTFTDGMTLTTDENSETTYYLEGTDKMGRKGTLTVVIDKKDPVPYRVGTQIWGDKSSAYPYVTTGSTAVVWAIFDEKLPENSTITIGGKPAKVTYDGSGESSNTYKYVATLDIPEDFGVKSGEEIPFEIKSHDAAGNETVVNKLTQDQMLVYDNTAPNLQINDTVLTPENDEGTVFFDGRAEATAVEEQDTKNSGVANRIKNALTNFEASGRHYLRIYGSPTGTTYKITVYDNVGNEHTYTVHAYSKDSSSAKNALSNLNDGEILTLPANTIKDNFEVTANDITIVGSEGSEIEGNLKITGNNVTLKDVDIDNVDAAVEITGENVTIDGGNYTIDDGSTNGTQGNGAIRIYNSCGVSIHNTILHGGIHLLDYECDTVDISGNNITLDYTGDVPLSGIVITPNSPLTFKTKAIDLYKNNTFNITAENSYFVKIDDKTQNPWKAIDEVKVSK